MCLRCPPSSAFTAGLYFSMWMFTLSITTWRRFWKSRMLLARWWNTLSVEEVQGFWDVSVFISSCNGAISICGSRCPIAAILLCPLYALYMYYVVDGCMMSARYLFDIPRCVGGWGEEERGRGGRRSYSWEEKLACRAIVVATTTIAPSRDSGQGREKDDLSCTYEHA